MPYTTEQALQALHEQQLKDLKARAELYIHNSCVQGVQTYNLPYRILWDYEHSCRDHMEIDINPWYPLPTIPKNEKDRCRPWDLNTAEGVKAWEYYFTRFLVPYYGQFDSWSMFDFFGSREHAPEEVEQKRAYYKALAADYIEHAEHYDTQPHYKTPADYNKYDLSEQIYLFGYIDRNSDKEQAICKQYAEKLLFETKTP